MGDPYEDERWDGHEPPREGEDVPDASSLAGLGEYSATGGGSQPLHRPQLRTRPDSDLAPAMDSLRDMYRYSLAQATGDDTYNDEDDDDAWPEGPLHVETPRR